VSLRKSRSNRILPESSCQNREVPAGCNVAGLYKRRFRSLNGAALQARDERAILVSGMGIARLHHAFDTPRPIRKNRLRIPAIDKITSAVGVLLAQIGNGEAK
jgi:hypothetical protein